MKRKTIFLDLDGTILDVSERTYRVYKNILKKYNKKFLPKDKYLKLKRKKTSIENILKKTKAEDITMKFKKEWDKEIEKPDYLDLDKVSYLNRKTLLSLKNNWNLILVSLRKHPKRLFNQLRKKKIDKIFNKVLVSSKKSQKPKWKIKFELIKKDKRFDKTSSIIIGDTETDILVGRKLRIKIVSVLSGMRNKTLLERYKPDFLIKDFSRVKNVINKLNNKNY
jgi:phosphoglycolate phosphatase-like HAD superfamily hydrolase